jgi:hypothetical protein
MLFVKRLGVLSFLCGIFVACMTLDACGGGSAPTGGTGTSSSSNPASTVSAEGHRIETGPLKISGGGSDSYRIPGHHARVPLFGEEAVETQLKQAAEAEHGYLIARAERDWPKACSYISHAFVQALATRSKKLTGKNCAAMLAAVAVPGPAGSSYEATEVEAESLRSKGKRGFLLYRAATAPYFTPMIKEGGAWKVAAPNPTPFY